VTPTPPIGQLEISPKPAPDEREALERALSTLRRDGAPSGRGWWEHGLREAVLGEGDGGPGAASERLRGVQSSSSKLWSTSQGAKPRRR
jgi:hypothetical protein